MKPNLKMLQESMPQYFAEKRLTMARLEREAQSDSEHAMTMLAYVMVFAMLLTAVAIVVTVQWGWW